MYDVRTSKQKYVGIINVPKQLARSLAILVYFIHLISIFVHKKFCNDVMWASVNRMRHTMGENIEWNRQ